ncbi:MAG: type II secretion system protein GspD [Epsilonproteobacteria bacterium]|nr:MAG: type II secretion system protein GspD [Campylobacterota bacterium]RLA67363.1 MAG: type II secretion system protein GspD [Campylobacterota bacterium]
MFTKIPIIITLMLASSVSMAQFSKYKAKTDYGSNTKQPAPQGNPKKDIFGRSAGINQVQGAKKEKKYLQLNPETAFGPEVVRSFDFPDISLKDLVKQMQQMTGINLILDKDLKGKISIMAPSPITVGDAWKAFLTALNLNGYTLVKSGEFYKIVNSRDIRYTSTKFYTGSYTPDTENYVMRILPLKNINSTEITRSFRPFMSRYGRIIDIKQTNTIIIQETGTNINRLVRLIKFIDIPGHEESLQIIKVKNSSAQEIAKLLDQILKTKPKASTRRSSSGVKSGSEGISKIIAEPRTNSIIAMANAVGARQLRALIQKLDVKLVASSAGQIHVYYLNHGDAETLAKTLSTLVGSSQKSSSSRFSTKGTPAPTLFNAEVKITADKSNNAIVVTASPTDYLTIKNVIKKLDIAKDQVFVEGMLMETTVAKQSSLGTNIIGVYGSGAAQKVGFVTNPNLVGLLTGQIASIGGFFAGIGGGGEKTIQGPDGNDITVNSVNALITAIAANTDTNVLATPQILALDNTEATFEVGETVPINSREVAQSGISTTSVEQQKVALTLKLTPQINKVTRFITLKIDQKVEDFSKRPTANNDLGGVATTTRSTITTVVVRDLDTIAMGGLMRDRETVVVNKVPLLGDIPVIGWLFKNRIKSMDKTNLLFFLTPRILSPYETTNAQNVKDVINRRAAHLKDIMPEGDTFESTMKGLFKKAEQQEEGVLYDPDHTKKYKDDSVGAPSDESQFQVPDYNKIMNDVNKKKQPPKA